MKRVVFRIDPATGEARAAYDASLAPLARELQGVRIHRVSHIEPCSWGLRVLFHLIRRVSGEDGRAAAWTRGWKCAWRVNFDPIGQGIHYHNGDGVPFASRQAAIDFEVASLFKEEKHHVGTNSQN